MKTHAVVSAVMVAVGVIVGAFVAVADASAREIKTNAHVPPGHVINTHAYATFNRVVERESGGALSPRLFLAGQLVDARQSLTGLRDGIADIAIIVASYFPAQLRAAQIVGDLDLLGKDTAVVKGAVSEFYMLQCAPCLSEFIANGVVPLAGMGTPPYILISRKPVTTLAEFKGLKIRSGSGALAAWGERLGGVTVSLSVNEIYEGLSSGVIEATLQTRSSLRAYGFWDVAKHVTDYPISIFSAATIFNAGATFWKDARLEERRALLAASVAGMTALVEGYDLDEGKGPDQARAKGVTFHRAGADFMAATRMFEKESVAAAITNAAKRGTENGAALAERYVQLIEKWTRLVAPVRTDYRRLQELYRREIFDKIDAGQYAL